MITASRWRISLPRDYECKDRETFLYQKSMKSLFGAVRTVTYNKRSKFITETQINDMRGRFVRQLFNGNKINNDYLCSLKPQPYLP